MSSIYPCPINQSRSGRTDTNDNALIMRLARMLERMVAGDAPAIITYFVSYGQEQAQQSNDQFIQKLEKKYGTVVEVVKEDDQGEHLAALKLGFTLAPGIELSVSIKNEKYFSQSQSDKIVFGKVKVTLPQPGRDR